jgi:hypothetical protein
MGELGRTFDVKGKLKLSPESDKALFPPQSISAEIRPGQIEEIQQTENVQEQVPEETETVLQSNGNGDIENIPSGYHPADKTFWLLALEKLTENFLSVKVWTIFVFMYVTAYLCYTGHMSGTDFATSNGSIISVVYALRESFKTIKVRQAKNLEEMKNMKI